MIYTVTLNPALDKSVVIPSFAVDRVNRIAEVRMDPGGKGINVTKSIEALGGKSCAYVVLGGAAGRWWQKLSEDKGFSLRIFETEGETRTNVKITDPVSHTCTDINEPGPWVDPGLLCQLQADLTKRLRPGDVVVLSGSVPTGTPTDIYGRLVNACHRQGCRVIVDAEKTLLQYAVAAGVDLIKPNRHELEAYVGYRIETEEDCHRAAEQLLDEGAGMVLLSMGAQGARLYQKKSGPPERLSCLSAMAPAVEVFSTVGAGDSMLGAFACGWDRELSQDKLLALSVAAGTAATECPGTQAPARQRVAELELRVTVKQIL